MQKNKLRFVIPLLVSAFLRLWRIGQIPKGLSINEVNFGLKLSKFLGSWVLNEAAIRLPFAILGIISLPLVYISVKKITDDEKITYISYLIICFSPWHIAQSRIVSYGVMFFVLTLILTLVFSGSLKKYSKHSLYASVIIFSLSFLFSMIANSKFAGEIVNLQRRSSTFNGSPILLKIFSNKYVESFRIQTERFFEYFDFGNFFFSGHPRERWGIEEVQKFPMILVLFVILGLFAVNKKLFKFILTWTLLCVSVLILGNYREPSTTLPLIFPVTLLISAGVGGFLKNKNFSRTNILKTATLIIFVFELFVFLKYYFNGLNESNFSGRAPIYREIIKSVESLKKPDQKVLVSKKLVSLGSYFSFYLKDRKLESYDFSDFNIKKDQLNYDYYIDVLPDDPNPAEPLYTESGNWPEFIKVLETFYDPVRKQTLVVYKK